MLIGLDSPTASVLEGMEIPGELQGPRAARYTEARRIQARGITILTPFPGTPLYDRLRAEGRILGPERWDLCTLFDVNYRPKRMSVEELRAGSGG